MNLIKHHRKRSMPSRLATEIKYSPELKVYIIFDPNQDKLKPDTPEYFAWIASLKSFHFEGREGHFTARKEPHKTSRQEYWTAYRKANHKQLRRYLGASARLTIEHLETAARHLAQKASDQPPAEKRPRKRPEKREVLHARIEQRDRQIAQLKKQLEEQKTDMLKMQNRIQQLENMLRAKR
jgi:hypothetical protein